MEQNDLIKRGMLIELYKNVPEEIKQILRVNEERFTAEQDAKKKAEAINGISHTDFVFEDGYTTWRVFEFPELTNTEIANLQQIAANNKQNDIYRMVDNIHFWVKFWSILSIIVAIIIGILTAIL